mgnify:CR=1 FL=1
MQAAQAVYGKSHKAIVRGELTAAPQGQDLARGGGVGFDVDVVEHAAGHGLGEPDRERGGDGGHGDDGDGGQGGAGQATGPLATRQGLEHVSRVQVAHRRGQLAQLAGEGHGAGRGHGGEAGEAQAQEDGAGDQGGLGSADGVDLAAMGARDGAQGEEGAIMTKKNESGTSDRSGGGRFGETLPKI